MAKRLLILCTCLLAIQMADLGSALAKPPSSAPNLIVVLVDDLSVDLLNAVIDSGYAPNIDQYLVTEGVTFENAFVTNAVCCPSRATLLRGQYSHNHNVLNVTTGAYLPKVRPGISSPGWLPEGDDPGLESSTIATWLQSAGYYTGHIGRYLNGYGVCGPNDVCIDQNGDWPTGEPDPRLYIPAGWDHWQGLIDQTTYQMYDYQINDNGATVTYGDAESDYQTDVLAQLAAQFIDDAAAGRDPFFLQLATFAPHIEPSTYVEGSRRFAFSIRPAPRHEYLRDGSASNGELPLPNVKPSFNEQDVSDKPSCPVQSGEPAGNNYCVADKPLMTSGPGSDVAKMIYQYKSMMAAMIAVDDLVGTLVDRLVANEIDGDTVILFTSDNGWLYGEHRATGKELGYEESIRVPLLIRSPGHTGGVVASQIVLNNDIAPTLAALGEAVPPYDPDGTSLVPLLEDTEFVDWHRRAFLIEHWYIANQGSSTFHAIRYKNTAYDFYYSQLYSDLEAPDTVTAKELYNLASDPYQMQSAALDPAANTGLTSYLSAFSSCEGEGCRSLESLDLGGGSRSASFSVAEPVSTMPAAKTPITNDSGNDNK